MRESEAYRDNLASLLAFSGGKHLLTVADVAKYCGRDRRVVERIYNIQSGGITAETLARRMAK